MAVWHPLNVLRKHFQKARPAHEVASVSGMDWDAVDERIDAWAERGRLRAALAVLSDPDRELLLLVGWEELSQAEAAMALGISHGAARVRLHVELGLLWGDVGAVPDL